MVTYMLKPNLISEQTNKCFFCHFQLLPPGVAGKSQCYEASHVKDVTLKITESLISPVEKYFQTE